MEDLSITETESRYFGDLFLCCDVEKTGKVPILKATELFRSANLTNDVIRQITTLSGVPQQALHISRPQFYSCLKLIAAYQASIPLRSEVLQSSINLPLPRFSWKDSPPTLSLRSSSIASSTSAAVAAIAAAAASSSSSSVPSSTVSLSGGVIGSAICVTSNSTGSIVVESNGLITGSHHSKTQEIATNRNWRETRSPDFIDLARTSRDMQNETTNSDLQSTDSEVEHNESGNGRVNRRHRSGSPEAWSTNSDSPTPTNSVAERQWAKDTLWQGLLGDEHRQLLGTEEESSDRHSSDDDNDTDLDSIYQITSEQREYYNKQFKAVQPDPNGLLSGHIARVFFEKSRIPVEELRRIWQLCDVTRDGALSLAEFTAAMHLVVLRRNNIPLPPILPPCLHPSVLNQIMQPIEPPEADLLHLGDDDKIELIVSKKTAKENDYKRMIPLHSDKNIMNLSSLSTTSQTSTSSKQQHSKVSTSPVSGGGHKNRSVSNSPPAEPTTPPPQTRAKELGKDWTNQSREWTKFTESPTSNVSSPGPKPANFDMQRTAQAVVSDPQILHPVPLRVTPVGAEANDDESIRIQRKSESLVYENNTGPISIGIMRENDSSPKLQQQQHQQQSSQYTTQSQHRDSLQSNDLRAIQRPQPKKLPSKSIGAIPPPPQRESSIGGGSNDTIEIISGSSVVTNLVASSKKDPPPLPPPRPHRHARSSSLDLNKLKMGATPGQPEMASQNSFDVQDSANSADFAHFPESAKTSVGEHLGASHLGTIHQDSSAIAGINNIPPPPRPTISSLQTSQRVSAFEVYRKPNTPRNSQSPDSLQQLQSQPQMPSTNSSSTMSITSGIEYEKRVAAISETLKHVSFKHDKNVIEVLRHLREQNVLLLRLCNDLSEELLTLQQRKEEIRSRIENAGSGGSANIHGGGGSSAGGGSGNISTNITGGSGSSSGVHSNV